jgi:hypothetical protein
MRFRRHTESLLLLSSYDFHATFAQSVKARLLFPLASESPLSHQTRYIDVKDSYAIKRQCV